MTSKKLAATFFVAGTSIGAGMMALPMTLNKLGIMPSVGLLIGIWFLMYYAALIHIELSLQAGTGLPLVGLAERFSGRISALLSNAGIMILIYALLAAYLYGGASVIKSLLDSIGYCIALKVVLWGWGLVLFGLLSCAIQHVTMINRWLFWGLIGAIGGMIGLLLMVMGTPPAIEQGINVVRHWTVVLPIIFTSFGFQIVCHTMTNFCDKDPKLLKAAFFWGSIIPLVVYILWTIGVVGALVSYPDLYGRFMQENLEVGQLMQMLSQITQVSGLSALSWVISILAIVTSAIGVGTGLRDTWQHQLPDQRVLCALLTFVPPFIVAYFVPNAFIAILGFAGMIVVATHVLMPLYLLHKADIQREKFFFNILRYNWLRVAFGVFGVLIVLCELYNMMGSAV